MTPTIDWHKAQQILKWVVYSALLVNWGFYIAEDWNRAIHTLGPDSPFLDWTEEFATTIDMSAWLILLAMLELETYILEDEDWKGWIAKTVHGVRLVCFVMIAHTVFAYANTVIAYGPANVVEDAASFCDVADQGITHVYNLEYTEITSDNCTSFADVDTIYQLGDDPLVATLAGLELERQLAWGDLVEAIAWIVIIAAIELVVRLQERGVTGGGLITTANRVKLACYVLLGLIAAWWATLGHWLYTWDEFVWIAGFAAIEMNISDWRDEIEEGLA